MDRRDFMRTTGGIAIGGMVAATPLTSFSALAGRVRAVVFQEPGFPSVQGMTVSHMTLEKALTGVDAVFAGLRSLESELARADILIMPYGSAFPQAGWDVIRRYLESGGGLVNLGGVPFSVPVTRQGDVWSAGIPQSGYHKALGITQSFVVPASSISALTAPGEPEALKGLPDGISVNEVYELYVRFADTIDHPSESGSAGTKDALIRPLVLGIDGDGNTVAAPVVSIDRLIGDFAGGKWILAAFSGTITEEGIGNLVGFASVGVAELVTRPSYACFREGERPSFTVQLRRPGSSVESGGDPVSDIRVTSADGTVVDSLRLQLRGDTTVASASVAMHARAAGALGPGLYRVVTTVLIRSGSGEEKRTISHETGFWIYDQTLMAGGKPFTADRYTLLRDGRPFYVTGTTYMGSDVHRKFLFEPNPWLWDRDFGRMKLAAINMVRTGIWTAWRSYMLDPGTVNESILRSIDAFILTARKHDIPVIFTFFAFLPEMWGGENAYLDPRSVNAQKEFVAAIVRRYASAGDVIWDLINEPSFCSPQNLWNCRPNYDRFETAAWLTWLRTRYALPDHDALRRHLQNIYRCPGSDALSLPAMEDFAQVNITGARHPLKVIDYRLFAQEIFSGWVREISETIRRQGNPRQMITVGQDEAGTNDSPNPQFHADEVDFTCLHNWWLNDDLLWDSIVTKSPLKPNLVGETGVMFYETMDGAPWRTEEEVAGLLERKLVISIVAGGAGFIEWIWNTNPYMKSDNEAAIGLHRADGSIKPEYAVLRNYSRFMEATGRSLTGRIDEGVVLVLPHSQMFSTRNVATDATKRAVRAMCYANRIAMRAVSEYRLDAIGTLPKLMIVPCPGVLCDAAWTLLLECARKGATVLITGPVEHDEHWFPSPRLSMFGIDTKLVPVAQEDSLLIDGREMRLSFRGEKLQRITRGIVPGQRLPEPIHVPVGSGRLIWSPLPVELAEQSDVAAGLYAHALVAAGVTPLFSLEPANTRVLVYPALFASKVLYAFVSESATPTTIVLKDMITGIAPVDVLVPAQRATLIVVDREKKSIVRMNEYHR